MDNISHTLVGALIGEAIARRGPKSVSLFERRRLFVPTLAIGSNLPDVDLLYTSIVQGKLDYLLHHRGHTHTLIGAFVLAALLMGIYHWRWRRRGHVPTRVERLGMIGAALLGPLLHVAMDATNSYGVHPYWPFDNQWRYGDAVFIIEPLFWAAAAPLALLLQSVWARCVVGSFLFAGVGLSIGTGMVPPSLIGVFVSVAFAMLYVAQRWPQHAAPLGVALWLTFTATFWISGQFARERVEAIVAASFPTERLLDVMRTPMPMNPVCWEVMLVQTPNHEHFTIRRAVVSLMPAVWTPSECPTRGLTRSVSAPLTDVAVASSREIRWYGELTMARARLRQLAASHCEASALLQFARIPWLQWNEREWRLGDLRYDREGSAGFAEVAIAPGSRPRCPFWGAPWIAPRADLLR